MAEYISSGSEEIIIKQTSSEINLTPLVQEYLFLKSSLQNLPSIKDTPDQETLDYWNSVHSSIFETEKRNLDSQIIDLYNKIKPIYDAGLFPSKWNTQYQQLENYVNSI